MPAIDLRQDVRIQHTSEYFQGLGSYWVGHFEDREIIRAFADAAQLASLQGEIAVTEGVRIYTDRTDAPVFQTRVWLAVDIYEDRGTQAGGPDTPYYGGTEQYGATGRLYGGTQFWSYDMPVGLVSPKCLVNRLTDPTYVGYLNHNFVFRPGVIGFAANPFASGEFEIQPTAEGRKITLWFYMSELDLQLWRGMYGLALGVSAPSSPEYQALVDGLWRSRVAGPSDTALFRVIEGCTGIPLARENGEVVELVGVSQGRLFVVTNRHSYRFPNTHNATVAVGDVLRAGQSMTDALRLVEGSSLKSGDEDVTLPASFFAPDFQIVGNLRFPNARVAVQDGGLTAGGNRVTRFRLEGLDRDVRAYREAAADAGLWRALDARGPNAPVPPTATQLKPDVNPAVDLVCRHTKPHLLLLYGDQARWPAPAALQAQLQRLVDQVVPPHARLVIQSFRSVADEYSSQSASESSSSTVGQTDSSHSSWSSNSSSSNSSSSSSSSNSSSSSTFAEWSSSSRSTRSTASSPSSNSSSSSSSSTFAEWSSSSRSSASRSSVSESSQSNSSSSSQSPLSPSSRSSFSSASSNSSSSSRLENSTSSNAGLTFSSQSTLSSRSSQSDRSSKSESSQSNTFSSESSRSSVSSRSESSQSPY